MSTFISGPELIRLRDAAVKEFNESDWKELGAYTYTLDEVENHDRLLRSMKWRDSDYEGHALSFIRKMIGQNGENLDTVRNYIEKKSDDIGEYISSVETSGRKIIFSPNVFKVPEEAVDKNLVSIMMPFGPSFNSVLQAINSATEKNSLSCLRADDIWEDSVIIQDIFSLIFRSSIVICDFTDKNPNVFYEAGIAHTLGKHVIPITQNKDHIPFDLQHYRYIHYLNNSEGLEKLTSELSGRFQTLTGDPIIDF